MGYSKHQSIGTKDACECLVLPVGWRESSISHLKYLFGDRDFWGDSYYVCPKSGVIWKGTKVGEYHSIYNLFEKTGCRQGALDLYTVGIGTAVLYAEKQPLSSPLLGTFIPPAYWPEYPCLPLEGRLEELFTHIPSELVFECGGMTVRYAQQQWDGLFWIYLDAPLERGSATKCFICSPSEVVSQQVLSVGLCLPIVFTHGVIGEIQVESKMGIESSSYHSLFGFDKVFRQLVRDTLPPAKRRRLRKRE